MADVVTTAYESAACSLDFYYDNQTWKVKKVVVASMPGTCKCVIEATEQKKHLDGYAFPNANVQGNLRYNTNNTALAQTVTPSAGDLDWAVLKMWKMGSPVGDMWLELRNVVSGKPGSTVHATSEVKAAADVLGAGGPQVEWWNWPTPYTVDGVTQYAVVLQGDYPISTVNYIRWGADNTSPTYAGGTFCQYNGSTWVSQLYIDFVFHLLSNVEGTSWSTEITSNGTTPCPVNIQHVPDVDGAISNVGASAVMVKV